LILIPLRSVLAIMIVTAVAVGCAGIPAMGDLGDVFKGTHPQPSPDSVQHALPAAERPGAPLLDFLATARRGDSTIVSDPNTGERVRVVAGRMYYAASGRYCRRYETTYSNSPTVTTNGLACKRGRDDWQLEKLIVNPNDVNAPQRSLMPRPGSS